MVLLHPCRPPHTPRSRTGKSCKKPCMEGPSDTDRISRSVSISVARDHYRRHDPSSDDRCSRRALSAGLRLSNAVRACGYRYRAYRRGPARCRLSRSPSAESTLVMGGLADGRHGPGRIRLPLLLWDRDQTRRAEMAPALSDVWRAHLCPVGPDRCGSTRRHHGTRARRRACGIRPCHAGRVISLCDHRARRSHRAGRHPALSGRLRRSCEPPLPSYCG